MEDGEVAVLTTGGIQVYNAMGKPIEKEHHRIDWEVSAAEKGGYPHFMLKEIFEQPQALRRAIMPRLRGDKIYLEDMKLTPEKIRSFTRIFIVACGSSYHVGVIGKYNLEHLIVGRVTHQIGVVVQRSLPNGEVLVTIQERSE